MMLGSRQQCTEMTASLMSQILNLKMSSFSKMKIKQRSEERGECNQRNPVPLPALFLFPVKLEPNMPAGASKSKEINVSWIELTSWLKTASTVPTEVRLPAGCFHWGSGWPPYRDPPGEVWAETGGRPEL